MNKVAFNKDQKPATKADLKELLKELKKTIDLAIERVLKKHLIFIKRFEIKFDGYSKDTRIISREFRQTNKFVIQKLKEHEERLAQLEKKDGDFWEN